MGHSPLEGDRPDFQILFENAPGLYLVLTPALRIVAVSNAYLQATMTQREQILGRELFEVFPDNPNDPSATGTRNLADSLKRVLGGKVADTMAIQKYDIRRPQAEGGGFEERFWSPINSPVFKKNSREVAYIIHRVEDVTEFVHLKQRDDEKNKVEQELRLHADKIEIEIVLRAQELQEANKKLRAAEEKLRRANEDLEAKVLHRSAELMEANQALQKSIEDLKTTQQQMVQQEKLRALGEMASGIAHDFNNTLAPILGYADLILYDEDLLKDPSTLKEYLGFIHTAAKDASKVVARLGDFYRRRQEKEFFATADLSEVVQQTVSMTRPKWKTQVMAKGINVDIETKLTAGAYAEVNVSEIREMLTNLIFNAVDAMPEGGMINIEVISHPKSVVLKVQDAGVGMSPEVKQRCLEPFFSTKGDQGTGLGLSMVYGIIRRHQGHLEIESQPGSGTTFIITMPVAQQASHDDIQAPPTPPTRPLTILYVDDDPKVRDVTIKLFQVDGHQVEIATHGKDALDKFKIGKFDVVISDRTMPVMGGDKLVEELKKISSNQPIVVISGTVSGLDEIPDGIMILKKPITLEDLRRVLGQVASLK